MKYQFERIPAMGYDDWADAAYKAERVPVLPQDKADRLCAIFTDDGEYTPAMHRDNLEWLTNLQMELNYVWSGVQRSASGMSHLAADYKIHLGLKENRN